MSELLLQIIALRLAALVLAGLLLQALPDVQKAPSHHPPAALQQQASARDLLIRTDPNTARDFRDMHLHD